MKLVRIIEWEIEPIEEQPRRWQAVQADYPMGGIEADVFMKVDWLAWTMDR